MKRKHHRSFTPARQQNKEIKDQQAKEQENLTELVDIIERDIEQLVMLRLNADREASKHQRLIEKITAQLGRPATFYVLLLLTVTWILLNVGEAFFHWHVTDQPPFFYLQGFIGLIALFTTTSVLITQNRQSNLDEQRSHLQLELALLADRKISKVIEMIDAMRKDSPHLPDVQDPQIEVMKENADPEKVIQSYRDTYREAAHGEV